MHRIEDITEYTLPEGTLCFGQNGWVPIAEEIIVECGDLSLKEVLDVIWHEHQGLLGAGELALMLTARTPKPTGYLIFEPEPEAEPSV